jgi:hypothetical protein
MNAIRMISVPITDPQASADESDESDSHKTMRDEIAIDIKLLRN